MSLLLLYWGFSVFYIIRVCIELDIKEKGLIIACIGLAPFLFPISLGMTAAEDKDK